MVDPEFVYKNDRTNLRFFCQQLTVACWIKQNSTRYRMSNFVWVWVGIGITLTSCDGRLATHNKPYYLRYGSGTMASFCVVCINTLGGMVWKWTKINLNLLVWWIVLIFLAEKTISDNHVWYRNSAGNRHPNLVQIQTLDAQLCLVLCNRCRNKRKRILHVLILGTLNIKIWGVHSNACGTKSTHCPTRAGRTLRTGCSSTCKQKK